MLTLLYRGPLSSCNFGCDYCPFAKREESLAELRTDAQALERLATWVEARPERDALRVFFTPWGEALTRRYYRETLQALSHLAQVHKVAVQTNLSAPLDWLERARTERIGIWATYHPAWMERRRFLAQCQRLLELGVSFSVGVVGLPEHIEPLEALRRELPSSVYVWVNAVKAGGARAEYEPALLERLLAVDPLLPYNLVAHESQSRPCAAGASVISVDGEGTVRRCHFIAEPLGNLYVDPLEVMLRPRPCSNARCGCHIGYVHMPELGLDTRFGDGLLERAITPR